VIGLELHHDETTHLLFSHEFGLRQAEPGDCSGEAIPVPIPNTEVKLSSAENTEGAAPRQDRSSPGSLASWRVFLRHVSADPPRICHIRARVGYPDRVNEAQLNPCPWLLDDAGSIQPDRPRRLSRCGADAARPDLSHQTREGRCLVGAACEIRAAREATLGSLAATIAPQQPIGDPSLLSDGVIVQPAPRRPWARLIAVAVLAALLIVGGGPIIGAISPVVQSLIGSAESETPSPSSEPTASAAPTESPLTTATPTATPSSAPTPTPAPTASPSPTSGSGATWVVRRNDTISGICLQIGGDEDCVQKILTLNGIADPRTIQPGQVLQLP
jgi:LysM repeat protein